MTSFWKVTSNGMELLEGSVIHLHDMYDDFFLLMCGYLNARTASRNYYSDLSDDIEELVCVQGNRDLFPISG